MAGHALKGRASNNPRGRPRQEFREFLDNGFAKFKKLKIAELEKAIGGHGDRVPKALHEELASITDQATSLDFLQTRLFEQLEQGSEQLLKVIFERLYGKVRTQPIRLNRARLADPEGIENTATRLAKAMLEDGLDPGSVKVAVEVVKAIGEIQLNSAHTRALNAAVDELEDDEEDEKPTDE